MDCSLIYISLKHFHLQASICNRLKKQIDKNDTFIAKLLQDVENKTTVLNDYVVKANAHLKSETNNANMKREAEMTELNSRYQMLDTKRNYLR